MPVQPLPDHPSLEHLRKQAKRLHRSVRDGDASALAQVREFHPHADAAKFTLADAQRVVARTYDFASWPKLKEHLAAITSFAWEPCETNDEPDFFRNAVLVYGDWHNTRATRARRALTDHPELARADIYAASAAGDVDAVRAFLARDRALANTKGGPFAWEPLLYACYSRIEDPRYSTLEVARVLLAHGADPNAGFLWGGNLPPFTALTGAFGEGEDDRNQPPHPQWETLARMLLDAGADPNDEQTLYNRHFHADDTHFRILFEYGLGEDKGGPWLRRFERMRRPPQMLVEELWSAARKNFVERVKLLVERGTDVNGRSFRDNTTPYEAAVRYGNLAVAEYLAQHGARKSPLPLAEQFASALVGGRREEVRALLREHPDYLQSLGFHGRVELLHRATESGHEAGVRLMAELGFELSGTTVHQGVGSYRAVTPLHNAAWAGNLSMIRALLDVGADPHVRDHTYNGTPLGWAAHNQQQAAVELLMPYADLFDAVSIGGVERLRELLDRDPSLIRTVDSDGDSFIFYLHQGTQRIDEIVTLLRDRGADFHARHHGGKSLWEFEGIEVREALERAGITP